MSQPIQSFSRNELQLSTKGNMGGTRRQIALIRARAVAAIPAADANTRTISTAITFVDDTLEVFGVWDITKNSGDVRHELQGEMDGKSYTNFCDFNVAGQESKILFEQMSMANEDLIAAIQDRRGDWRLIGSINEPATLQQATGQVGKAPTDSRHTAFIIQADDIGPAPILAIAPQTTVTPGV